MKKHMLSLLLIPALALASSVDDTSFKDPYVRAMPAMHQNSSGYLDIINDGDEPIELVGVRSPVGAMVQFHEMVTNEKGVAKMQVVPSISLPAHSTTSLKPGGLHLMFIALKSGLHPGQLIPVTFTFSDGMSRTIEMPVKDMSSVN